MGEKLGDGTDGSSECCAESTSLELSLMWWGSSQVKSLGSGLSQVGAPSLWILGRKGKMPALNICSANWLTQGDAQM